MRTSSHKVLLTGGAKGIGFALAKKFHEHKNAITIVGRDQLALDGAAFALPGIQTVKADISTTEGRDLVLESAENTSVLINNAGIQLTGLFVDYSDEAIYQEVETNLIAPLALTKAFLPKLVEQDEAAIVNITSILAIVPKQSAPVYCATKAGLRSFTRVLRWQLEGTKVRVMEVLPPLVDTAMTADRVQDKISPEQLANEFWRGYVADRAEILVGKSRVASILARFLPSAIERKIRQS